MESLWPATTVVLGALVILGIFFWMWRPVAQGANVEESLRSLGKDYTVFSGLMVTQKRGVFCVSHLVVSPYGIFLIDERDEHGSVYGMLDQKEWLVTGLGAKKTLYNPLWRSCEAANKLQSLMGPIPIISLIVFVHARLKRDLGHDVVTSRDLPGRIKQDSRVILDEAQIKQVLDRLSAGPLIIDT